MPQGGLYPLMSIFFHEKASRPSSREKVVSSLGYRIPCPPYCVPLPSDSRRKKGLSIQASQCKGTSGLDHSIVANPAISRCWAFKTRSSFPGDSKSSKLREMSRPRVLTVLPALQRAPKATHSCDERMSRGWIISSLRICAPDGADHPSSAVS